MAKRYRLHTLAGPLTNRTMDNGFVIMALTLVARGDNLLGEPDERDKEDVKVRMMFAEAGECGFRVFLFLCEGACCCEYRERGLSSSFGG